MHAGVTGTCKNDNLTASEENMRKAIIIFIFALFVSLSANDVDFAAVETDIGAGDYVSFYHMCNPEPDRYLWEFGDGTTSMEYAPTHQYTSGGLFSVQLTAYWGADSLSMARDDYINVIQARFNVTQYSGTAPFTTSVTNTSLGNYTDSIWDFGDGTSPLVNPTGPIRHTYQAGGDFDVTLTVLIPYIGYHKATEMAKEMKDKKQTILEVNTRLKWLDDEKLKDIIRAQNIVKEGFSIKDLL